MASVNLDFANRIMP